MKCLFRGIRIEAVLCFVGVLLAFAPPCLAGDSFAVIVNRDNPLSGTSEKLTSLVARLFLKQQRDWPNQVPSRVYDREADSPEHQQFVEYILKMSEGRLSSHWVKMKQVSGETPPRVIRSKNILFRFLVKHKGGIGIVKSKEAKSLPPSLKVLFRF